MAASSSSSSIGYAAPIMRVHHVESFINPEPITKKGIVHYNPRMIHISSMKRGGEPVFIAVAEKLEGVAIKTVYDKESIKSGRPLKRYLGKIGSSRGVFVDDVSTYRTITKKKINFETMLEKLAYDLYQELGRGLIQVPKTYLSKQPILDTFTKTQFKALVLAGAPQHFIEAGLNPTEALPPEYRLSNDSIRIMSRYYTVDEYQDFTLGVTRDFEGATVSFVDFIKKYHRPPSVVRSPNGNFVPLRGFVALLAVGRVLADTDLLGGRGDNAGFTWIKDNTGEIVAAETVKIDPGMAFQFETEHNWAYNTHHGRTGIRQLADKKNIQVANSDDSVTIHWQSLNSEQRIEFLQVLFNSSRYLNTPDVLDFLFYRDGRFNRSEVEQIPREVANRYRDQMVNWITLQLEIYGEELAQFKQNYPTQVIRAHYIDHWGELPLPASDETFPIRELFTQLTLIEMNEKNKQKQDASSTDPELPERDSLFETFQRMDHEGKMISLEALFEDEPKGRRLRKVLLIGRAGIGKSTLCQKMAHDWGSGRLWNDCYRHVYWLPLRELNALVEKGASLDGKTGDLWLAETVARLILKDVNLVQAVLQQIQADRQSTLILLDGYDEASPHLMQVLTSVIDDPELTILLTSRPGVTQHLHHQMDRLVENIGFSEEHIERYLDHFFSRKEEILSSSSASSSSSPIEKKEAFLEVIRADANLFAVAHIPLQLQMLATLWERGGDQVGFPSTLTGLYFEMVECLFNWQLRRAGKNPQAISGRDKTNLFVLLGEIGLVALESGRLIVPRSLIAPILDRATFSEKDLLDSGLIRAAGQGLVREYCFLHLTFQEFLIAYTINERREEEKNDWIINYRYKPQFQLVIAFLAGMIHRLDTPDLKKTKDFFEVLHTPPGDLSGIYQHVLMLKCLNECQNPCLETWIKERFCLYDTQSDSKSKWGLNSCRQQDMMRDIFSYPNLFNDIKRNLLIGKNKKEAIQFLDRLVPKDSWGEPWLLDLLIEYVEENKDSKILLLILYKNKSLREIKRNFKRLNSSQLERLKTVIPSEPSLSERYELNMYNMATLLNKIDDSISELELLKLSMIMISKDSWKLKEFNILLKQFPKYSKNILFDIKNKFVKKINIDSFYVNSYILLTNSIFDDQLDDLFLEEFSFNIAKKLTDKKTKFLISRYHLFKNYEEIMSCLISSIFELSSSKILELINQFICFFDKTTCEDEFRCKIITGVLSVLIKEISNDEVNTIINQFVSNLISHEWDIWNIDGSFLIKLNLSEYQIRLILKRTFSKKRRKQFSHYNLFTILFILRKNYPNVVFDFIWKFRKSLIKHTYYLCTLTHMMASSTTMQSIVDMTIGEFLEESIEKQLSSLVFLSTLVDSERLIFFENLRSLPVLNILDPFGVVWSQQLIRWQEQLRDSPEGLDFKLIEFGIIANSSVRYLLFCLIRAFPNIYIEFINCLCDFLLTCSIGNFKRAVSLIPPWSILTLEQKDNFVDIFRCRFAESSLACEPLFERLIKHLVEKFPQMISTKFTEIFLNPRFNFHIANIHDMFSYGHLSTKFYIHIPIEVILNADDQSTGRKYEVLVDRLIRNKVRLYLLNHEGEPIGCWVEDNKETRISYEHFCELQQRILVHHPLRAYIASYQAKSSTIDNNVDPSVSLRNLTFFNRWLNQRLGSGWKISLSPNGEQLLITREDGSLDLLKRARGALVDFTDGVTLKFDNKKGNLVIQGVTEEINQFLDRLEEEHNTSRPASSAPPESNSFTCMMS